jgi:hypothetical protein
VCLDKVSVDAQGRLGYRYIGHFFESLIGISGYRLGSKDLCANAHKPHPAPLLGPREQPQLDGYDGRLGAVRGSQLGEYALDMILHGARAYQQLPGDLLVGVSPRY